MSNSDFEAYESVTKTFKRIEDTLKGSTISEQLKKEHITKTTELGLKSKRANSLSDLLIQKKAKLLRQLQL